MPTTLWIWDILTRVLQTVMIFHSPIAKVTWHSSIDELLLVRCEGDESRPLVHLWDPSWATPTIVDFAPQMVGGKVIGKTIARWLNTDSTSPALFFSDSQDCILASFAEDRGEEGKDVTIPWVDANTRAFDIYGQQEESPLTLVPANVKYERNKIEEEEGTTGMSVESDEMEDTFRFKKFIEPTASKEMHTWN